MAIGNDDVLIQAVSKENVTLMVKQVKQRSPLLNNLYQLGKIDIVGAMYDIETGRVLFYDN